MKHRFPTSIAKLCNLETLIVNPCKFRLIFNTSFLPPGNLEDVTIEASLFCEKLLALSYRFTNGGNIVPLENLQILGNMINFRWTKEVLDMMPNLKKLVISYEHDG
ncbi:putative late blight resistance protein-like protein R1A-10 [Forsythia ovata]|uniref:Late blight resistance protein-like protein R1A-10 n=1 Tax=Forsythia ovata TaxID=205694 RepID=A0ABD1TQD3_9LAMI